MEDHEQHAPRRSMRYNVVRTVCRPSIPSSVCFITLLGLLSILTFSSGPPASPSFPLLLSKVKRPAACGIYYYYHVGKNGGTSVMQWQRKVTKLNPQIRYVSYWYDYRRLPWQRTLQNLTLAAESGELSKGKQWLSVHHHHRSPGLRFMMPIIRKWRQLLKQQGCTLILATTLREPVSRTVSLASELGISLPNFFNWTEQAVDSQARYLLHNSCEPRPEPGQAPRWCHAPSKISHTQNLTDTEIEEVLGYLQEFDLVAKTEELDELVAWSMAKTGWNKVATEAIPLPRANRSKKKYNVSDDMKRHIAEHVATDLILYERVFGEKSPYSQR